MSEAANKLLTALMELPEDERLALADAVYASVPKPPGASEVDPEFDALLARRVAEIREGKVVGAPAAELMDRLRRKYQK